MSALGEAALQAEGRSVESPRAGDRPSEGGGGTVGAVLLWTPVGGGGEGLRGG